MAGAAVRPGDRQARRTWVHLGLPLAWLLMAGGWLLLWPAGLAFSRVPEYTEGHLRALPLARGLFDGLLGLTRTVSGGAYAPVPSFALLALLALALALASAGYLLGVTLLARTAWSPRVALAFVLAGMLSSQVLLFLQPVVFTTDPFSYLAYGHLSGLQGLSPYRVGPSALQGDTVAAWVHPLWQQAPTVYGPLWERGMAALAQATRGLDAVGQTLVLRVLMDGVHLLNVALVWSLLPRLALGPLSPAARVTGLAVFAWNPLVLFDVAGGSHNDALAVTFLLLGLLALSAIRPVGYRARVSVSAWAVSGVALLAGALVKATSLALTPLVAAAWLRSLGREPRRLLACAALTALAGGGLAVWAAWPWLGDPVALIGPLIGAADAPRATNSVQDLLALSLAERLGGLTLPGAIRVEVVRTAIRWTVRMGFLVYALWEASRVWQAAGRGAEPRHIARAVARSGARLLLVLLVVALTWVQSWYFLAPLALASTLGGQDRVARLAVAYSLAALVLFNVHDYWYLAAGGGEMPGWLLLPYALLPLAVLFDPLAPLQPRAVRLTENVAHPAKSGSASDHRSRPTRSAPAS